MLWFQRVVPVLSICLLVFGCSSEPEAEMSPEPILQAKPMLPAHPLPGERQGAAKGDEFDDYRLANSAVYGITAAPQTPLRAVAQYDAHQTLLLTWTGNFPKTFSEIVAASKPVIDVVVIHEGNVAKQEFINAIGSYGVSSSGLTFMNMSNDSIWMRDYGPLSARSPDGTVAFIDPRYYHQRVYDDAVPTRIANNWGIRSYRQPLSWEGGTYIADGHGNCYYSQGVYWYNAVDASKVHKYQLDYLGCQTNIVLKPLVNEGTTHSDMFAKLVSKNQMVLGSYKTWQDSANASLLNDNEAILEATTLNDGSSINVTRIPMPSNSGQSVWRTYANSLFINGVNLVPVYNDDTTYEAEALAVWQSVLPNWTHVKVDSTDLIQWSGAVHCITMTVPNGALTNLESAPDYLCGGSFDCYPNTTGGGSCGLSFEGCCDGNTWQHCGPNGIENTNCGSAGCGWSATTMAYGCGGSGNGPANAPLECNNSCIPDCAGKSCGSNGCGGSCGSCPSGAMCEGGQCAVSPAPCDGISYAGCCDGNTVKFCLQGQLNTQACNTCGWVSANSWYDCGGSGEDPSGQSPKDCPGTCTPNCNGKACGDDGCGSSCGTCAAGQTCSASQQCIDSCTPNCDGKNCGDNGCGGSCGTCASDQTCSGAQQCVDDCTSDCTGKTCGDNGCGGSCGTCGAGQTCSNGTCETISGCGSTTFAGYCDGTVLTWCQQDQLLSYDCTELGNFTCGTLPGTDPPDHDCVPSEGTCTPDCSNKDCGADGCGGVCGTCEAGSFCNEGLCQTEEDPCDGLSYEGCCDDGVLNWCENNTVQTLNCGDSLCGWDAANSYYNCNSSGAEGPPEHPKSCGSSGCVSDCTGKVCGADGCGGSCGTCTSGLSCQNGSCVDPCGSLGFEGSCNGDTLSYCAQGVPKTVVCSNLQQGACCGWDATNEFNNCLSAELCGACVPECEPGTSGCNGTLSQEWTCAVENGCAVRTYTPCSSECDPGTGACAGGPAPPCIANCSNKACGTDGCGGSCGNCGTGESCNANGQCVAGCVADCSGKNCGSDGCGGSCGTCEAGNSCLDNQCVPTVCQPKCDGKVCGEDGCGGQCGTCLEGQICDKFGLCITAPSTCTPDCSGKQCGSDGCGGSCGVCGKEETCTDSVCIPNPASNCNGVPTTGTCQGNTLQFCGSDGQLNTVNCTSLSLSCGADGKGGFDCVDPNACVPACAGKVCGSNGCGGACGICGKNDTCTNDGQCVSDSCTPQCTGLQCGADGCGGTCGSCSAGFACTNTGMCTAGETCPDGSLSVDGVCATLPSETAPTGATAPEDASSCASTEPGRRAPTQQSGGAALMLLFLAMVARLRHRSSSVEGRDAHG